MATVFPEIRCRRYGAGGQMARHEHTRPSFCLVLSGVYEEQRGRDVHELGACSLIYCPPGEAHAQRFGREDVVKLVLTPSTEALALLDEQAWQAGRRRRQALLRDVRVGSIGARLQAELSACDPFSRVAIDGLAQELLALLGRELRQQAGPAVMQHRLDEACAYLAAQLGRPVDAEELAREVGASSAAQLARAFKARYGRTLGEHQRQLRAVRALQLLTQTRTPLAEIAASCGFCDQAHLTRAIKAHTGRTPGSFR